jgi:uncharacterized damage-inducible protein DinB
MATFVVTRPESSEYPDDVAEYVNLVRHSNIVTGLLAQLDDTMSLLHTVSAAQSLERYSPGKWSIRDVLGHIIDSERIFTYRALRIARGDQTPLPGFEQDDYVKTASADRRTWGSLKEEFELQRRSTVAFYANLEPEAWLRVGTANKNAISVRALAWVTAGHELHHDRVLRQRYLRREDVA